MTPYHPEIVVKLPDESVGVIRLDGLIGGAIRKRHGNDAAREWYDTSKWAKHWPDLLKVAREWVTVT